MKRPYRADTVVRVLATVGDKSFENTINNNNYSVINDNNNNKNCQSERVRIVKPEMWKKFPNQSTEKGPEVIAQTQRAVVKAAVPLLYTVLS